MTDRIEEERVTDMIADMQQADALATIKRVSADIEKMESEMLYLLPEDGQGIVEYALILVFVAVAVIVILALLGPAIGNVFSTIYESI